MFKKKKNENSTNVPEENSAENSGAGTTNAENFESENSVSEKENAAGTTNENSVSEDENLGNDEAAGTPESEETSKFAALAEDFLKAQEQLKKANEAYIRSVADFENFRRRTNEERGKNMIFAKGDLAKDLFPILDNFKLGLEAAEKSHPDAKSILEGFSMISSQIKNALAQHGIEEISPKVGDEFNPREHESISCLPSGDVPEEHILFVQRTGYKIGERLLRPAAVVIASKPL